MSESKYSCDECEYSTSIQANLTTHMKRKQIKVLMYPCDYCKFSPLMLTQLKNHIRKKHEIPCDQCALIAKTSKEMNIHSKRYHWNTNTLETLPKKTHSCNKCEYSATTARSLKHHIESKHERVRYPCNKCEYAATTSKNLKQINITIIIIII